MIEEIDLNITIPEVGLCMASMHPFVELTNRELYKWQANKESASSSKKSKSVLLRLANGKLNFLISKSL